MSAELALPTILTDGRVRIRGDLRSFCYTYQIRDCAVPRLVAVTRVDFTRVLLLGFEGLARARTLWRATHVAQS